MIDGARGKDDTRRTRPTPSTKQDTEGLTETELTTMEAAWVCTGSSVFIL